MSFRDQWYLATAGHVLVQFEQLRQDPRRQIRGEVLLDAWSLNSISRDPIPFDLSGAPKGWIDDDQLGLDFGLIALRPLYRQALEVNGIVPIREENWKNLHRENFEFFALLGIPAENVVSQVQATANSTRVHSWVTPELVPVTWETDPPDMLTRNECPRFIGRLPNALPFISAVGMSGGPIFAFSRGTDGQFRYWVVAIQSTWLESRGLICGCLVPYAGTFIEQELERLDRSRGEAAEGQGA
jgi:hypothetical protein